MTRGPMSRKVRRLASDPAKELGRAAAFLRVQARLWQFCARRLHESNLGAMSAALSFRTIFALIPTLVLAILAAGALGALEDNKTALRRFLNASGFAQIAVLQEPDADGAETAAPGEPPVRRVINVADEIEAVVLGVEKKLTFQRVGPLGAVLFIWTALTLLTTVEQSLNRVFQAAQSRSVARRVLLYWSAMTLGPLVLISAIYLGRKALTVFSGWPVLDLVIGGVGRAGPILVGILGLAAVYILMPNTSVHRRAALGGAAVAVLLWLLAKWAFSLYVQRFVVEGNIYGILGVLPLFLIWLHLSWMIFLFGAELANTAANIRQVWRQEDAEPVFMSPTDALAVTLAVARAFQSGQGPMTADDISSAVRLPGDGVQSLLDRLAAREVVCAVANGQTEPRYVLAQSPATLKVADLLAAAERRTPEDGAPKQSQDPAAIAADVESRMRSSIATLTVEDLLAK